MNEPSKTCTKCGETKPLEGFDRRKDGRLGRDAHCKACRKAEKQRYYQENKEARDAYIRGWRGENRDRSAGYSRKYRAANPGKIRAANQRNADKIAANARRWDAANPEAVRERVRKRKARLLGQYVAPVSFAAILQRDLGHCGICTKPIMGPVELDHIIPLAAGGTHEPDNVQCAHDTCNRRKSARLDYRAAA